MLIVDIPMPSCCDDCPMFYDGIVCDATGTEAYPNREFRILNNGIVFDSAKHRFDDCPIKGELVRCGECKHFKDGMCYNPNTYDDEKTCGNTTEDWFCADGERKDGEG